MVSTLRRARVDAWLIPLAYAVAGLAGGIWSHRLSTLLAPEFSSAISANAAIGVYSAIASGMIALTGVVFALMFVLVQSSASAFSPRLVFWVARDHVVSHALGVFTATFLYALTALAWIDRDGSGRVPLVGVLTATVLLMASIFMLISLTQRVSILQVNRMLVSVADRGRAVIDQLFPSIETPAASPWIGQIDPSGTDAILHRGRPQNVQSVRIPVLVRLASRSACVIEVTAAVGDAVLESMPLLRVHGSARPIAERRLRAAVVLGNQRTFDQDPCYAIRVLVDIAIRALSPAINDPTTAVQALDQLGDLLLRLGRRRLEHSVFRDEAGEVRVVMPRPSWEDCLRLSLDEILFCGASSVQVMRRMNALVRDLQLSLPEERRPALVRWRARVHAMIEHTFTQTNDRLDALAEDRQGLGHTRAA